MSLSIFRLTTFLLTMQFKVMHFSNHLTYYTQFTYFQELSRHYTDVHFSLIVRDIQFILWSEAFHDYVIKYISQAYMFPNSVR